MISNPFEKENPLDISIEVILILKDPTTFVVMIPDHQPDEHTLYICIDFEYILQGVHHILKNKLILLQRTHTYLPVLVGLNVCIYKILQNT